MVCTLAFRHGQSLANEVNTLIAQGKRSQIQEEFWGISDHAYPLTADGISQAKQLQRFLPKLLEGRTVLPVTSSFVRAMHTARIVLPDADWQLEDGFVERDFGDVNKYRGLDDPTQLFGQFRRSFTDPDFVPFDNGQTFRSVVLRVKRSWEEWRQRAQELEADLLLISCHGETLRALRAIAYGVGLNDYDAKLGGKIHNCQIEYFSRRSPNALPIPGHWHCSLCPPYDSPPEWARIC